MSNNSNRSLQRLGARQNQQQPPEALELLHYFRLQYVDASGTDCILAPGQLLPIWDTKTWRQRMSFTAVAINALRCDGRIITVDGDESPFEEVLKEAVTGTHEEAVEMRLMYQQLMLGNIGGELRVKPNQLPIGVLPMQKNPAEFIEMSVIDWMTLFDGVEQIPVSRPPQLRFYAAAAGDNQFGHDPITKELVEVREVPLPFSWQSVHNFDGLRLNGENDAALAMFLSQGVRKMCDAEGITGSIYVGYDVVGAAGITELEEKPVPLDLHLGDMTETAALYVLPFNERDPMGILTNEVRTRVNGLRYGNTARKALKPKVSTHAELSRNT